MAQTNQDMKITQVDNIGEGTKYSDEDKATDLYDRFIKYKTLNDIYENEKKCSSGEQPAGSDGAKTKCGRDNGYFFGSSFLDQLTKSRDEYYDLRIANKTMQYGDALKDDEKKKQRERIAGVWGKDATKAKNEANLENDIESAKWIWDKKKQIINDFLTNIDASIQYYEAQHTYNNRLKGVDEMQKIYNDNIIGEKDKMMEQKNIFSRLSKYNMEEEEKYQYILPWVKVVYWVCFGAIIFFLFKNEHWKNMKMYAFIVVILFLPALLTPITTLINTELLHSKIKSIYLIYLILGIILVCVLYFTGNLPFVKSANAMGLNTTLSPNAIVTPPNAITRPPNVIASPPRTQY